MRAYRARRRALAAFPAEMRRETRWVRRNSRKAPLTVKGRNASTTKPETWSTYDEARRSEVGAGVGFMLGGGFACIDLDHCFEDGDLLPWAAEVVAANAGTFTEVSMSGEGLHIFGLLDEAPGHKIRDGRNIEVYSRERYIALTGDRFNDSPAELAPLHLSIACA